MKKYVLHCSTGGWPKQYVKADLLAWLHCVRLDECIVIRDELRDENQLRGIRPDAGLVHLWVSLEGDYPRF